MLESIKLQLRITNTAYNDEINDLIDACKADLMLSGILSTKVADTTDALIKRAISLYCKANFGLDNPDSEKLQKCYELLKMHLCLSSEYTEVVEDV